MSTITKVRVWNDCGYTENTLEVPSVASELPQADYTIDGPINPNTADMFSKLSVPENYQLLMNASYLEVTYEWNNGLQTQTFYGWVDSVVMKSDTFGYPSTDIRWHVDLWRTYLKSASFGYGMVNRRPMKENDSIPPQPYPYRFHKATNERQSLTTSAIWWVYVNITRGAGETTVINDTYCFPVDTYNTMTELKIQSAGVSGKAVSFNSVEIGNWDEDLGLNPANITSAFISPMPPKDYTGDGKTNPVNMSGWGMTPVGTKGYSVYNSSTGASIQEIPIPITEVMTTDTKKYVIVGFDGEIVGELPWGIPVDTLSCRTIMSSTSGYLQFRTSVNGHLNGTCWTIPLIPIDVSENSWSAYVYSGSRQAEIDQRILNADIGKHMALQGAAMGATSNILGGAVGGFMSGAGPIGGALGAVAGLTGTAVSGMSAKATYNYQVGEVADRAQAISDYRAAMQPNGLIMAGTGFDAIRNGQGGISIRAMEIDDYSAGIRAKDMALYGAYVSEPTEDCNQLVREGGGLQITNLIVKGDIPVEAKRYLKNRLASGVLIK